MQNLRALIFDVDGTLVDSNDIHAAAWDEAFRHYGKELPYEDIRNSIGKGGDLLVPDLLDAREMRTFGSDLREYRKKIFHEKYKKQITPFPDVREQFESLRRLDLSLVLASSADKDEVKYFVDLMKVRDLIDGFTSAGDVEYSKPSPEIFEAALEKLGRDGQRAFVVGDTPYDILAAHRVSLPVVAVRCGGFDERLLAKAEFIWNNVAELVSRVGELDAYFAD